MGVQTVAILSPGDMGHAIGRMLRRNGFDTITCLTGRSQRTHELAAQAGIRDVPAMEQLVVEADLILSILVPAEAVTNARRVASAISATGAHPAYADCNAIAPATMQQIATIIADAGGACIDAGIIGGPPREGYAPRIYASGAHEHILAELDGRGVEVRMLGGAIGRASGLKMCYAALTKGTSALQAALLTAAAALGLADELQSELQQSQPDTLRAMQGLLGVPAKAFRWVGEMEEIAATFDSVGVTPRVHLGAADVFRMIAESPVGHERPETVDRSRTLAELITILAASLKLPDDQEPSRSE
jgi:3-hydroxyisobutyrate dehydrogenase-like beta-hydroxyacid dehydrogenase